MPVAAINTALIFALTLVALDFELNLIEIADVLSPSEGCSGGRELCGE